MHQLDLSSVFNREDEVLGGILSGVSSDKDGLVGFCSKVLILFISIPVYMGRIEDIFMLKMSNYFCMVLCCENDVNVWKQFYLGQSF